MGWVFEGSLWLRIRVGVRGEFKVDDPGIGFALGLGVDLHFVLYFVSVSSEGRGCLAWMIEHCMQGGVWGTAERA